MYHEFYGLREKPFSLSPDPRYLFLSDSHREALAHLLYGIEQGEGFIAITGEVGTGKTTLCRTLLQRIEPGTEVAFIFNPHLTALELLQAICAELGLETEDRSRRELMELLNRFLLEKRSESRRVILIIDEAQNLAPDTLEQVRMLSNLETDTEKLIQIILIGQPELDRILESPNLRQLRQRISVRWQLKPLSNHETRDYVRHRLRIAAGKPREIFSELALREIHRASRGIPRVVNLVCDRALLAGYGAQASSIGLGLVGQSQREIRGGARQLATPDRMGGLRRLLPTLALGALPALVLLAIGIAGGIAWQRYEMRGATPAPLPPVSAPRPAPAPTAEPAPSAQLPVRLPAPAAAPIAPAPSLDLETALARSSPGAANAASIEGLLFMWSVDYKGPEAIGLQAALEQVRAEGLSLLPLRNANVSTLRLFNHPALLRLRAVDGVPRTVLLTRLHNDEAVLLGLQGRQTLRVPIERLAESWTGEAYVAWRDFARLPDVILPGERGETVAWLQRRLLDLGFLSGAPSGVFDVGTAEAVRSFQRSRSLREDGAVGPLTKMTLYEALEEFTMPRLVPHGGFG